MNPRTLAALALCLASACGGSSDPRALTDEGSKALNSGDHAAAAKSFDAAVAALGDKPSDPDWLRAKLGGIQARTQTDASRAKGDFLELARTQPTQVTADNFSLIGSKLADAGHVKEAAEVLEAGLKAHPDSKALVALREDLGKRAESSGDPELLKGLEGLGYVGGK